MSYKDVKKAAKTNKTQKELGVLFVEFNKVDTSVLGEFVGVHQVAGQKDGTYYNQYVFKTDDGPVKFQCGGVFDSEGGAMMEIGGVYEVTYRGQEDLKGGRRVNKIDLVCYSLPQGARVGSGDDPDPSGS